MTERQEQALRGLALVENAFRERNPEFDKVPGREKWWSAGSVAGRVSDELPYRHQHGNGAKSKRSWSGKVPIARFIAPALRSLVKLGLVDEQPRWDWDEAQRSSSYRLTAKGRKKANELLARRNPPA